LREHHQRQTIVAVGGLHKPGQPAARKIDYCKGYLQEIPNSGARSGKGPFCHMHLPSNAAFAEQHHKIMPNHH
jgi:hypothetical protein